MSIYLIRMGSAEEIEELSALLNTHDETGDVNPDDFIREASVCAALAYCNSKVNQKDRGDFKQTDFVSQMERIRTRITKFYSGDSYSVIQTAIDVFISHITANLIMSINDQRHTPIFKEVKEDLSLVFTVLDGNNEETDDSSRVLIAD